jgi:hypothetical protein
MMIRMLIETEIPDEQIPVIAEQIADQPIVDLTMRADGGRYAGRFVGAQQVFE